MDKKEDLDLKMRFFNELEVLKTKTEEIQDYAPKLTRGEQKIPSLKYVRYKRFTLIENYNTYCTYCNRNPKVLGQFFSLKLGVANEFKNSTLKIKGLYDSQKLVKIEKQFYLQEILCDQCKSPQTTRDTDSIIVKCLGCSCEVKKPLR